MSNWDKYKPSTIVSVSFRAVGDARPYGVASSVQSHGGGLVR